MAVRIGAEFSHVNMDMPSPGHDGLHHKPCTTALPSAVPRRPLQELGTQFCTSQLDTSLTIPSNVTNSSLQCSASSQRSVVIHVWLRA